MNQTMDITGMYVRNIEYISTYTLKVPTAKV